MKLSLRNNLTVTGYHEMAGYSYAHVPSRDRNQHSDLPKTMEHGGKVYVKAGWSERKQTTLYRHRC